MVRKLRILLEIGCLLGFFVLFLDVHGLWSGDMVWLGKMQLVPAFVSGAVLTMLSLVILTLVLGRIYCSVVCPLGILQDLVWRCRRGRRRQTFRPNRPWLRLAALVLFAAALGLGLPGLAGILDPYSAFGRMATDLFQPLAVLVNNGLSLAEQSFGGATIAPVPLVQKGLAALLGAGLTFGLIAFLAWRGGRTWCNTLCPVGAFLGCLSRVSLFRPRIRQDRCVGCGLCAARCKAACIDPEARHVDASRCVACFDCLEVCRRGALTLLPLGKQEGKAAAGRKKDAPRAAGSPDPGRRAMLGGLAGMATGMVFPGKAEAAEHGRQVPIPALERKRRPERGLPVLPAGSTGLEHFRGHCTGCQLCVAVCPNHVLRSRDEGPDMLQPSMTFENGFCRTNCTACSEACPAGAIRPVSLQEKSSIQVGRAVIDRDLCIVGRDKVTCTACKRSCPTGAVSLVGPGELQLPAVDTERCIGCGACEYVCPSRPLAAIRVEGNLIHRRI